MQTLTKTRYQISYSLDICTYVQYVSVYVYIHVSRLAILSLKIKGTDWSTFAMYWGTTLNLLVMYPGFLSDSY